MSRKIFAGVMSTAPARTCRQSFRSSFVLQQLDSQPTNRALCFFIRFIGPRHHLGDLASVSAVYLLAAWQLRIVMSSHEGALQAKAEHASCD